MIVFVNTEFEGHWPVGTAAVVVAKDAEHATELLKIALAQRGLGSSVVTPDQFVPVPAAEPRALILCDGNY